MSERPVNRKLTSVFYADIAGYSRLTRQDEVGTHHQVMSVLDHASKAIKDGGGTVLRYSGDAILAEFHSVVAATETAVTIQTELSTRNTDKSDDDKIQIRIGINLGEVMQDRGEIFGDGVNLAARLEAAAQPGGICISSFVYEQISGKVDFDFVDGGEESFKNIDKLIRVYRWHPSITAQSAPVKKSIAQQKPSIAILPFTNMSDDVSQEHFCDGITEDIITALSRNRWYNVTARNSTFAYKGQSPDVRAVASALGVGYVLEGGVRKSGDRVRITAQLIDATTGNHVWAEQFNRLVEDEFDVQDEIAHRVASILGERIWQDIARNLANKSPDTYGPYENTFLGIELIHRIDPDEITRGKEYLLTALAVDSEFSHAHMGLGFCRLIEWAFWDDSSGDALEQAYQHALKLKDLAPDDAQTYRLLSRVFTGKKLYDEAQRCVERAMKINPDDGDIIGNKALFFLYSGEPQEAITWFDKVLELHAQTPHTLDIMLYWKSLAQFMLMDYSTAISTLKSITGLDYIKDLLIAACCAKLNQRDEAQTAAQNVLRIRPNLRVSDIGLCDYFRNEKDMRHLRDALYIAGIPGEAPTASATAEIAPLSLLDKPSIAVLPFVNMSNDLEQEYFADGISEDIITALSHIKQWFVVARNSSFVYKGRNVDIREIAKTLGVRYVLEGSVRKGGNKLRITGQLIEAESGTHLWAGKYDGDLDDVFDLQDKITESVVGAIEPSLRIAEIERSKRKPPKDIGAYDLYLQALPQLYAMKSDKNEQALDLLHKAIELDPNYAPALAYLGWGYEERITRNWGDYSDDDVKTASTLAHRAIEADRDDAHALALAGFVLVMIPRDYEQGLQAVRRARELNPNIAFVNFIIGASLIVSGNPSEGLICVENAIRVSPGDSGAFFFYTTAAFANLMCDRPAEAYELAIKSARMYRGWDTTYRVMAAALVQLDRVEEARSAIAKLLELAPTTTVAGLRERWPIRDKAFLNATLDALRVAGLPE
ncbi:MAG: adenylate cyclase [Gammaproteobacteria bacterium]|jgi:adenylate cyclase